MRAARLANPKSITIAGQAKNDATEADRRLRRAQDYWGDIAKDMLQLDPDNQLAQGTMDVGKHALKGSSVGEQALPEPPSRAVARPWVVAVAAPWPNLKVHSVWDLLSAKSTWQKQ